MNLRVFAEGGPCTITINPDEATVQAAVTAAADGDVICLNAGQVTYNNSIDISVGGTKAVEIRGAGVAPATWGSAGQTVIRLGSTNVAFGGYESTGHSAIISNIRFVFDQNTVLSTPYGMITWNRQAGLATKRWIIHHNDFEVSGTCRAGRAILTGAIGGLISHNLFDNHPVSTPDCDYVTTNNNAIEQGITDDGSFWASPSTMGSNDTNGQNNLYIESNRFNNLATTMDGSTSSRWVWRFNEMHNASTSDHGFDSSVLGDRHGEIYNNAFLCDAKLQMSSWIGRRGGTGMIFNNDFAAFLPNLCGYPNNVNHAAIAFAQYRLKVAESNAGWPGLYPDSYPMSHQMGWGWISGQNQTVGDATRQNQPGGSGLQQALEPYYLFHNTYQTTGLTFVDTGYVGESRAWATSASDKAAGNTLTTSGYVSPGQDAIVVFADLVGGSAPSVHDDKGNTWTPLKGGTNGSMRLSAWYAHIVNGGQMTITITFDSSSSARAGTLVTMRGLKASPIDQNPPVVTVNASPYNGPASGTLSQPNELVLGYFALNGPTSESANQMVNDSIQAINPDQRAVSSGYVKGGLGIAGTMGGTDTSNVSVAVTFRTVYTDVNGNGSGTASVSPSITDSTANRNGLTGTIAFKVNGNTAPGTASPLDLQATDFIQPNREFYDQANSFDGTSGTGSGPRSARPTSCTTGVAYWSTDQGNWNTSGSGGQGVLDKCTAPNTWTNAWYVPYIYPHPMSRPPLMAASCSSADVQAKIDSAVDGDTVYVPAGDCTWTTGITISKYLNVIANGTVTLTDNTCNGACDDIQTPNDMVIITESAAGSTRFQGFTLKQGTANHINPGSVINLRSAANGKPIVIASNTYTANGGGNTVIAAHTKAGVISGNTVIGAPRLPNCADYSTFVYHQPPWDWATPTLYGIQDTQGDQNLYMESNTVQNTGLLENDFGARTVVRYNTLINASMEGHGDTNDFFTRYMDVYSNNFVRDMTAFPACSGAPVNVIAWVAFRGGTGLIHDNVIPDLKDGWWGDKPEIRLVNWGLRRNSSSYACWSTGTDPGAGYPSPMQIGWGYTTGGTNPGGNTVPQDLEPLYIWGNTGNGNYTHLSVENYPLGNSDSCPGTDASLPSATDYVKQNREFYVDTPKPGYTPFVYPHPLISGIPPPPPPGTNPPPPGGVTVLTLNLPATLPLNATITAQVPTAWTVTRFDWVITSLNASAGTSKAVKGSLSAAPGGTLSTTAAAASLSALSLTPGKYTISVTAYNGSTLLGSAQATTTLVLADLSSVRVYPNPWRSDRPSLGITFDNLPGDTEVRIFTTSGHLVRDYTHVPGAVTWNLNNENGDRVASGVYVYLITTADGSKKRGKVAVIK